MVNTTTNKKVLEKNVLKQTKLMVFVTLSLFCLESISSEHGSRSLADRLLKTQTNEDRFTSYLLDEHPDECFEKYCNFLDLADKHYTSAEIVKRIKYYKHAKYKCRDIKNELHNAGYEPGLRDKHESGIELFKFIYRAYLHYAVRFREVSAIVDEQQNARFNQMIQILEHASQKYFRALAHHQKVQKILHQQISRPKPYYGRF